MTANVLSTFAEGPAGRRHPSRSNLAELGITDAWRAPTRRGSLS